MFTPLLPQNLIIHLCISLISLLNSEFLCFFIEYLPTNHLLQVVTFQSQIFFLQSFFDTQLLQIHELKFSLIFLIKYKYKALTQTTQWIMYYNV